MNYAKEKKKKISMHLLKPTHVLIKYWLSLFFRIAPTLCNKVILQFIKPSQLRDILLPKSIQNGIWNRVWNLKVPQKIKKKTQEVIMWFLLCSHSMILIWKLWKKEVRLDSRVCINSKENEKYNEFSQYYYLFGIEGAGPFTRGSRFLTQDIQITNL